MNKSYQFSVFRKLDHLFAVNGFPKKIVAGIIFSHFFNLFYFFFYAEELLKNPEIGSLVKEKNLL